MEAGLCISMPDGIEVWCAAMRQRGAHLLTVVCTSKHRWDAAFDTPRGSVLIRFSEMSPEIEARELAVVRSEKTFDHIALVTDFDVRSSGAIFATWHWPDYAAAAEHLTGRSVVA